MHTYTCTCESHPRQLILLWKRDCLGFAVLLCFVICSTVLASSSFFISLTCLCTVHVYTCTYIYMHTNSVQQFAHVSTHGQVERSQSGSVAGKLTGSSLQQCGGDGYVVVEAGIVQCSALSTTSTSTHIRL